jgi:Gas vesicle synthesis protein GvpL/GvpF
MAAAGGAAQTGRYVYCLAGDPAGERADLGPVGLDGATAHVVPSGGISAVVHECPAEPYRAEDDRLAAGWVMAHHRVVHLAWERWEAVLPMTFNTIVAAAPGEAPEARLRAWLDAERAGLAARLETVRGMAEYGLQVFWDRARVAAAVPGTQGEPGAPEADGGAAPRSRGLAYLHRQRLQRDARRQAGGAAEGLVRSLAERAGAHAERVRVERPGEAPEGLRMVANLSCLAPRARERDLAAIVSEVAGLEGHRARLVGPLPPYSFAR